MGQGRRVRAGTTEEDGEKSTVYADLVLIGHDRAEATGSFTGYDQPFPADLERALIDKFGARVTAG